MGPIQLNSNWAERTEGSLLCVSQAETWIWCVTFDKIDVISRIAAKAVHGGYCDIVRLMARHWGELWRHRMLLLVLTSPLSSPLSSSQLWPTVVPPGLPQTRAHSLATNSSAVRINSKCLISSAAPHRKFKPSPIIAPSASQTNGFQVGAGEQVPAASSTNELLWEHVDSGKAKAC